jgi:hypothetical protein
MSGAVARVHPRELAIRWTIGNVSDRGWEALRLSIWGAHKLFGPGAAYVVVVNGVSPGVARERAGDLPEETIWRCAREIPIFLRRHFDASMAEGVGWKLAPLRVFPDRYELALDNDCILWKMPEAIHRWLEQTDGRTCVFAEDVARGVGQFSDFCGPGNRNSGIRGLPPRLDFEWALRTILAEKESRDGKPVVMSSELDEQGLQTAAIERFGSPLIVAVDDVTICSPFPPHLPHLGRCGAHLVGTNARRFSWELDGRNGIEYTNEHWLRHRADLYERVGIAPPAPALES